MSHAKRDREVEAIVVHRIDRLSRSTFHYLTIKGKLRAHGVRIASVVEAIDSSPVGELIEHIMIAQAEFYSVNLAMEVKKGLEERLRRGKWNNTPPIGYLMQQGVVVRDPARAPIIRRLFERWSIGNIRVKELGDELHSEGLVSPTGKKLSVGTLCRVLHNPFYSGLMVTASGVYPGSHPPLITQELFERSQEVFRQKSKGRGITRRHMEFVLAQKLMCPTCGNSLIGELHQKPSGKQYRYYRCHRPLCRFSVHADEVEAAVVGQLLELPIAHVAVPKLKRRMRVAKRRRQEDVAARIRALRQRRVEVEQELTDVMKTFVSGGLELATFDLEFEACKQSARTIEWMLSSPEVLPEEERGDVELLRIAETLDCSLKGSDPIVRRQIIANLVERVRVDTLHQTFITELKSPWELLVNKEKF